MSQHATGTFDVTATREPPYDGADGVVLARTRLVKQFLGELEASSTIEMLAASGAVKGSAGYVAMERVTGRLAGRAGSFVLQHSGTMERGAPSLSVTVVPDTGTGELTGLAGRMAIDIRDGQHFYDFEYTLGGA